MMNTRTVSAVSAGTRVGRLISLAAFGAAENMAIDQAILNSVSRTGVPVLRFYQWAEPTLSLGYFQGVAARAAHGHSDSICCVRRTTGGGAIVHDRELTYSVSIPVPASSAGPRSVLYQQTHAAITEALAVWGVHAVPFSHTGLEPRSEDKNSQFLCFQRRTAEDLIVSGYKVLGVLSGRVAQLCCSMGASFYVPVRTRRNFPASMICCLRNSRPSSWSRR